jgi:hypothetical protein
MLIDTFRESRSGRGHDASPRRSSVREWVGNSLVGHIALVELIFALPIFLLMSLVNLSLGLLTPATAVRSAATWFLLGLLGATAIWYSVTAPQRRRERERQRDATVARN